MSDELSLEDELKNLGLNLEEKKKKENKVVYSTEVSWNVFLDNTMTGEKEDVLKVSAMSRNEAIEKYAEEKNCFIKKVGTDYIRMGRGMYLQAEVLE